MLETRLSYVQQLLELPHFLHLHCCHQHPGSSWTAVSDTQTAVLHHCHPHIRVLVAVGRYAIQSAETNNCRGICADPKSNTITTAAVNLSSFTGLAFLTENRTGGGCCSRYVTCTSSLLNNLSRLTNLLVYCYLVTYQAQNLSFLGPVHNTTRKKRRILVMLEASRAQ